MSIPTSGALQPGKSGFGKKLLKIVGGFLGFIVVIFVLAMVFTANLSKTANIFFDTVAAGDLRAAYDDTSKEFQKETPFEQFTKFVDEHSLREYKSFTWDDRLVKNNDGTLTGTIALKNGGTIPFRVEFLKVDGTWKIYGLKSGVSGLTSNLEKPSLPSDEAMIILVKSTMNSFALAVEKKDFTKFYSEIAALWKPDATPEKFKEYFGYLKIPFTAEKLKEIKPVFSSPPSIQENTLVVAGYYPNGKTPFQFQLKYVYEHPEWKLYGIFVK